MLTLTYLEYSPLLLASAEQRIWKPFVKLCSALAPLWLPIFVLLFAPTINYPNSLLRRKKNKINKKL